MPRAIGLDLGSRRIGVALCDSEGRVATPYKVVERSKDRLGDHRRIRALYDEVEAELIVVGLPLSLDGSVGPAASKALAEADELRTNLGVRVETQDERLSTVAAERALLAAVILQSWLDSPHEPTRQPSE
jgi:putative Holliday junction resolvase